MDRARRGDSQAFSMLVRQHREKVFCLAVSILGKQYVPEAEDVTQEVFLKAHRSLGSFRGDSEFSSWLYRITFNQAVNVKARARYHKPHLGETALATTVSSELSPDKLAENAERDRVVGECILRLPDTYQSTIRLYYWLGQGAGEIAEMLGVPENTVKSYLHRARLMLRNMLTERGYQID